MSIIEGKCPNCGAPLKVDTNNDAAICEFCNTPYVTEKAINAGRDYIKNQNITNINAKQDNEWTYKTEKEKNGTFSTVETIGLFILVGMIFILAAIVVLNS